MTLAKAGDTVKVHYTGTLDDGTIFDSSEEREPLEFQLGEGQVIPGFEDAVVGMNVGDIKTTRISSEEAYGLHDEDMVLTVPREQFPPDIEPELDQQLQLRQPDGSSFEVTIIDITEDNVTLDGNHPLAGEALTFTIQLVEIS